MSVCVSVCVCNLIKNLSRKIMDRGFRSSNEMLENVTFDSVTFVEETLPINDGEFCCGSDGVTLAA